MTGKYQAYPEYQDSWVEWLGQIPKTWDCLYGKRLFSNRREQASTSDEQLAASQKYGVIPQKLMMAKEGAKVMLALKGTSTFRHVEENDFVISLRSFEGGIEFSQYSGCVSPAYTVLNPDQKVEPTFFKKLLKSPPFVSALQSTTDSLRDGKAISFSQFGGIQLPIPPKSEQIQIAGFLDHETGKIDLLIEKQQELIALLKEKRQAVISHAVTKGLNPQAPLKDSGIEWLGQVPEHWTVRRLKHSAVLQSGIPKGKDLSKRISISVPMLRVANVQDGFLDLSDVHLIDIEPSQLERFSLQDGDVLMNEGGDNDKLGRGAIWRNFFSPCIHQNHVFAIRPLELEPEWLDLVTRASYARFHFYRVAKQSTNLASISSTNIKETPLVIPPQDERLKIIEHIDNQAKIFEKLESDSKTQITLLQERRTALISAAVTGKIDVRDWQSPKEKTTNSTIPINS